MNLALCLDALRDAGWSPPEAVVNPLEYRPTDDGQRFQDGFDAISNRQMEGILGWALHVWYADRCATISIGFDATYGPTVDGIRTIKAIGKIREYEIVWPHKNENGILFAVLATAETMIGAMVLGIQELKRQGRLYE